MKCLSRLTAVLTVILLILCSCGTPESKTDSVPENNNTEKKAVPFSPEKALPGLHYTNAALVGNTAFLCGTGNSGQILLRADPITGRADPILLPSSGTVFCLGAAEGKRCVVITDSSRLDASGTPRDHFTLFEIEENGDIIRESSLDGIEEVNLLAIGTPAVQGCALLGENALILIDNRLLLLDPNGKLLDDLTWHGKPRLAGGTETEVWLADQTEEEFLCAILTVSSEGKLRVEKQKAPEDGHTFVRAFGQKELFYTADRRVFAMDPDTGKTEERWSYAAAPSGKKEIWFNGEDLLLELDGGWARFLRIE